MFSASRSLCTRNARSFISSTRTYSTMSPPATMKAIKSISAGKAEIKEVPLPKLRPDYALVKVTAVALNPTDWKHVDFLPTEGATVGCDYAGIVEEVGSAVTKNFKKGDRIAGFTHGVNALQVEDGSFAEYLVSKADLQMKIPDNLNDEEAATLGVGISTVGQSLYQTLGLPIPGTKGEKGTLLIYGASSATGSLAIQFAKLSGWEVLAICSPRNFDFVKSLGADATFDYNDPECGAKIREYTKDNLTHTFDCISEKGSPEICCAATSSRGGTITYLLPVKHSRDDVKAPSTLAYTIKGEDLKIFGQDMPGNKENFEYGKMFWGVAEKLIGEGKVKVHPPTVGKGLEGVFDGFRQMREGKVSGTKLVYKL